MAMATALGFGTGTGGGSGWVTTAVEKATSDFLTGPDWTMNIEICDSLNSQHLQVKDVVKSVKKRLQHKNAHVQFLALTLLETMMKNCGDYVHFQVAENLLSELVKIVRKKTDMRVRDKILSLLLSWQEAFGGAGGKHPRYFWAYDELRRSGVQFPERSSDAAPIFTPPISRRAEVGYGMPSNSSRRLEEAMAADNEGLSMSSLDSMRDAMDLLSEMLQAVNPSDREAVKEEIIVDLVDCCRSNQKKLIQMLTTTGDEDLLGRGLELNDNLQNLLAKHDAIASGSPIPVLATTRPSSMPSEVSSLADVPPEPKMDVSANVNTATPKVSERDTSDPRAQMFDDCEEDEFSQLARRHAKAPNVKDLDATESMALVPQDSGSATSSGSSTECRALALPEQPPVPVRTKQQDMIDLLSLTLSTTPTDVPSTAAPSANTQTPLRMEGYPRNQTSYDSYVASWAQTKPQLPEARQPEMERRYDAQPQPPQYTGAYPAPPWAPTPGYYSGQFNPYAIANATSEGARPFQHSPLQSAGRPLQNNNSFSSRDSGGTSINGNKGVSKESTPATQKPFIPPYRLFEDLNVLGSSSQSMSGSSGQGMVGGRK